MAKKACDDTPGSLLAAELEALNRRAQQGDAAALPTLRSLVAEHPEVWQILGGLAAQLEESWIGLWTGKRPLGAEAVKQRLAELKAELAGKNPSALERILVEQIGVCWLQLTYLQQASALDGESVKQSSLRLNRLNSANKRFLDAVKTLTNVRKLLPKGLASPEIFHLFDPERQAAAR